MTDAELADALYAIPVLRGSEDRKTLDEAAQRLRAMEGERIEGLRLEVGVDAERFRQAEHEIGWCRSRWHIQTTVHSHRFPYLEGESPATLILHAPQEPSK